MQSEVSGSFHWVHASGTGTAPSSKFTVAGTRPRSMWTVLDKISYRGSQNQSANAKVYISELPNAAVVLYAAVH